MEGMDGKVESKEGAFVTEFKRGSCKKGKHKWGIGGGKIVCERCGKVRES